MSESPPSALDVRVTMQTDIGRKRQQNQDAIGQFVPDDPAVRAAWGQIVVLADGVGGLPAGDLASQYAVSTIISSYYDESYHDNDPAKRLARAIAEANNMIYDEGQAQNPPTAMATTVVAAVIRGRDLIIGSVGDSPAYLLREDKVRKLTQDHNLENLQRSAGLEPPADSATGHKLVRALGHNDRVKVDIITGRVRHGDHVILCSDGLTRYTSPEEIGATVADLPPDEAVATLIDVANERGGADNISVIVIQMLDDNESLLKVRDPMEAWGQPRRIERTRATHPERPRGMDAAAAESKPKEPSLLAMLANQIVQFVLSNMVTTVVSLGVLLVFFVIIMFMITNRGGDDKTPTRTPTPPAAEQTATAAVAILLTDEANLAATQAEIARMTLTPPTATFTPSPAPTSGPMLEVGMWFRVTDGDAISGYTGATFDSDAASPLEAGSTFRVMDVDGLAAYGPWYEVVDNYGVETRWVNGPSLHQRVIVVNDAGDPLPDAEQPLDVPPFGTLQPSAATPQITVTGTGTDAGTDTETESVDTTTPTTSMTATVSTTPTPALTIEATQTVLPPTATHTPGPTATPNVTYGVENWAIGDRVILKTDLNLCRVPDVTACDAGTGSAGMSGIITDGPRAAGEHWWWEVELPDGRAGWIAQVLLGIE